MIHLFWNQMFFICFKLYIIKVINFPRQNYRQYYRFNISWPTTSCCFNIVGFEPRLYLIHFLNIFLKQLNTLKWNFIFSVYASLQASTKLNLKNNAVHNTLAQTFLILLKGIWLDPSNQPIWYDTILHYFPSKPCYLLFIVWQLCLQVL